MTDNIVYEPHPVSLERKAELRAKGMRIIDKVFGPVTEKPAKTLTVKTLKTDNDT